MAPLPSLRGGGQGLPEELTSFVGRRQELRDVRRLLTTCRLVTLTGTGGVGKTRLALRAAQDVARAFPHGVHLVELAALRDGSLLPQTVADALGLHDQAGQDPLIGLGDHLRRRNLLLILDNGEHLVEPVAQLVGRLLRDAGELRVLVTSRHALHADGEYVLPVAPLPVPQSGDELGSWSVVGFSALELFATRASAVLPGFEITASNRDDVARLCQRLDGLPLAIELAAVRLRALSVAELASRLDDRFRLLSQGARTAPARHQALLATVEWSFDLCTPIEQLLWCRMSVFAGSFDLASAEAVCCDEALPASMLLDAVTGLVDKSIVFREELDHRVRFRLLEVIREFGEARMRESGDHASLQLRHRDWYVRLVDRAADEWFGPRQLGWSGRFRVEYANLRAALEFCLASGASEEALHITGQAWFLWLACGHASEGRRWLERATSANGEPTSDRAWALGTLAYVALSQGDTEAASAAIAECRRLGEALDDPVALAYATHLDADRLLLGDDLDGAIATFTAARSAYAELAVAEDYPGLLAVDLGTAYLLRGDVESCSTIADELRRHCERHGEQLMKSQALWLQGLIAFVGADYDLADELARQSLGIKRSFNDTAGMAQVLDLAAWIAAAQGHGERAAVLLGAASHMWSALGAQLWGSQPLLLRREECESRAIAVLGAQAFDSARDRGIELSTEDALAYALGSNAQPAAKPAPKPGVDQVLTRREVEVAGLIADGMTNKEIASTLVLSPRTIESHVDHILNKLGFSSRSQVAAYVAENRGPARAPDSRSRRSTT